MRAPILSDASWPRLVSRDASLWQEAVRAFPEGEVARMHRAEQQGKRVGNAEVDLFAWAAYQMGCQDSPPTALDAAVTLLGAGEALQSLLNSTPALDSHGFPRLYQGHSPELYRALGRFHSALKQCCPEPWESGSLLSSMPRFPGDGGLEESLPQVEAHFIAAWKEAEDILWSLLDADPSRAVAEPQWFVHVSERASWLAALDQALWGAAAHAMAASASHKAQRMGVPFSVALHSARLDAWTLAEGQDAGNEAWSARCVRVPVAAPLHRVLASASVPPIP